MPIPPCKTIEGEMEKPCGFMQGFGGRMDPCFLFGLSGTEMEMAFVLVEIVLL